MTNSKTPFHFGEDERKGGLTIALGYFDEDAPTQVIACVSPVGLGVLLAKKAKRMEHEESPAVQVVA